MSVIPPADGSCQPGPGDSGPSRAITELLIGALAGSALLPFIQAMATKAGEDVYQLIRGKLSRQDRKRAEQEIRDTGTVTVADQDSRVILQIPRTVNPVMAARLDRVRLPGHRTGWLLVRWEPGVSQWLVENCAEPPPTASTIE